MRCKFNMRNKLFLTVVMDDKQYVKGPSNINQTSFKQNEEVITY